MSSALLLAGPAASRAVQRLPEERIYKVDAVRAEWLVPGRANESRVYVIAGARYEDVESGQMRSFARAEWFRCRTRGEGLLCGGGPRQFEVLSGTPTDFEFADDLTSARLRLVVEGRPQVGRWTTLDPTTDPFGYPPVTSAREESCNGQSGTGRGLYRSMQATGSTFGRRFRQGQSRGFTGIERYVLRTECDPEEWWRQAEMLPPWGASFVGGSAAARSFVGPTSRRLLSDAARTAHQSKRGAAV